MLKLYFWLTEEMACTDRVFGIFSSVAGRNNGAYRLHTYTILLAQV